MVGYCDMFYLHVYAQTTVLFCAFKLDKVIIRDLCIFSIIQFNIILCLFRIQKV